MERNNRSIKLTWDIIFKQADEILNRIFETYPDIDSDNPLWIYGIPRGGQVVAGVLGYCTDKLKVSDKPDKADIIVDDLYDSGSTFKQWKEKYPQSDFYFLFDKRQSSFANVWLEFPWEREGKKEVEDNVRRILEYLGEDTNREGLIDTPKRYIKFWNEFLSPPDFNPTTFSAEGYDQMIIQSNIPFYSVCEHHLAPFFGQGYIAYLPDKKIVGLSKLARTLDKFSRRLQNQERITNEVVDYLMEVLEPKGVGCVLKAQHMCMEMRGVKKHNTFTTTSALRGVFLDKPIKDEFIKLIKL